MIVLVNPPCPSGKVSNKEMMGGFGQCYPPECHVKVPPIDIPYTAAVLRDSKEEVAVIDCLASDFSPEDLLVELRKYPAEVLFIRTSTPTFDWDVKVARKIKEQTRSKVVFFGPHVGVVPDDVLSNPYVDGIVLDEPEYTIRDIAIHGFQDVPGLWYKDNGNIVKNKKRDPIGNLDELPFPAWDMLPFMQYTIEGLMPDVSPTLFMLTTRGCPYECGYCPYPVAQGARYRKRSVQSVLAEFDYLVKQANVRNVVIRDAEFTLDRQRVVEICEGLIGSEYDIFWRCETRADTLDEELVELMHRAGCIGINMGIESKSDEVCKQIGRKPLGVSNTENVLRKCRELGVHTFCFFIVGLPGDNVSTIRETLEYAITLNGSTSQFTVATPYLGTPLHDWATQNKYIDSFELSGVTGYEAMMRNENLTAKEILSLRFASQRIVDTVQDKRRAGEAEEIKDDTSLVTLLANLHFSKYRQKGVKRVIVYGTSGVSIERIKKAGFDVLAVIDEGQEGMQLNGTRILSLEFLKLLEPEAVLISPYKSKTKILDLIGNDTVVVEALGTLKRIVCFTRQLKRSAIL